MHLTVVIQQDGPGYWSQVSELPGCFASGRTLSELSDALGEAIGLYLWDTPAVLQPAELSEGQTAVEARPAP